MPRRRANVRIQVGVTLYLRPGQYFALDEIGLRERCRRCGARRADPVRSVARSSGSASALNSMRGRTRGSVERRLTRPRDLGCNSTRQWSTGAPGVCLINGHHTLASMRTGLHMSWMSGWLSVCRYG
jgi:hypothetical protein